MDKNIERTLEKVRKLVDKNQVDKADHVLAKALELHSTDHDLLSADIYISLKYKSWQVALARIIYSLRYAPIQEIIQNENIALLFDCFLHDPAFRSSLFEYLLNHQYYSEILYILDSVTQDQSEQLVRSWEKAAEGVSDAEASGYWYLACGIAKHKSNRDEFKDAWRMTVRQVPGVLPGLIAFCKKTGVMDLASIEDRIFLIELFLLSGSIAKGLTLMKVMGNESVEYATLLLERFKTTELPDEHQNEFIILKTSLALMSGNYHYLSSMQGEWASLSSEQLFNIQKAVSLDVNDSKIRKRLLLHIVQAYFTQEDWESAAQLLETMDQEEPDSEVMAMMEHLLERYPIIPHLHIKVGDFQLDKGLVQQALSHYDMVRDVPEYHDAIITKFEKLFEKNFSKELVESLLAYYPSDSDKVPLLGLNVLLSEQYSHVQDWFPNAILEKIPGPRLSPFWHLFLVSHLFYQKDYLNALNYSVQFIEECPEVAYEIIPLLEQNIQNLKDTVIPLVSAINSKMDELECSDVWAVLLELLERSATISQNVEHSTFFKTLHKVESLLHKGEVSVALQMLQRMAQKYEDATDDILKFLDSKESPGPFLIEWAETKFSILLRGERFEQLLQFGKPLLLDSRFREHVSMIHQYLGWANQSLGHIDKAIEHFCYGSLEKKWYRKNIDFFRTHLFHGYNEMLPNVLSLVHQYADEITAQDLLDLWYETNPSDLDRIYQFQEEFFTSHPSPRSTSQTIIWAVECGEYKKAREILMSLDPRIPEYGDYLPKIVQIFKLKQPQDPTARFLLGRYHLFQGKTSRAVDVFRNLIQDLPHTLDDVFVYLKKTLNKGISKSEPSLIFGLLIRIALDQKLYNEAILLLREFGKWDQKGSSSFLDGVFKVLKTSINEKQAYFEFTKLNAEWGDYKRVCEIEETGILGEEMLEQRLEWLKTATEVPSIRLRAMALRAKLNFEIQEFEKSKQFILEGFGDLYSTTQDSNLLDIAQQLVLRFPTDLRLKRVVAFSSWRHGRPFEARPMFEELLICSEENYQIEAFAMLKELGVSPAFGNLFQNQKLKKDEVLGKLKVVYDKVKEHQLKMIEEGSLKPGESVFFWLLDQGRFPEYRRLLQECEDQIVPEQVRILKAYYLRSKGKINQAAFSLLHNACPSEIKKMFFMEAGLWEQALLIQDSSTSDLIVRKRIWDMQGKPKLVVAHLSHIRSKKHHDKGEEDHVSK